MTAGLQETAPLLHLASKLGVRLGHGVDLAVGARRVRLLSNDPVVVAYAGAVLRPAAPPAPGDGDRPPDAVCLAVLADPAELDRMVPPDARPDEPVALHRGRTGRSSVLSASNGTRLFRIPGRDDRFVTDAAARTVLYVGRRDDPVALREPAWLAEALLVAVAAQDGPVLAAGAVGSASGTALLLDGGSGTAAVVLPLLYEHGADLVAWSAVHLTADPVEPDRVLVHALPGPCEVPADLVRRAPGLIGHVRLDDRPSLALPDANHSGGETGTLTFTADEIGRALSCSRVDRAPLALVVARRVTGREAALDGAAQRAAARYPAWHGIGSAPEPTAGALLGEGPAAVPWAAVDAYDAPAAGRVGAELRRHALTAPVPDLPDARRWPRAPMTGRWVAVMEHRRLTRGMKLERWQTRAVCAGAVHELMTTPSPPPPGSDRVDDVSYLGFAEFGAGLLAVGDAVREADGTLLGHVLGFDDTHLPNHMNVILLSEDRHTGRQRGLVPGDALELVSPADAPPAPRGESE